MFRRRLTLDQIVTTEAQKARLTERRNALRIKIRAWEIIQPIYMPGLLQYLAVVPQTSTPLDERPESHIIYLPSTIAPEQRAQVCIGGLMDIEACLRVAQCHDALENLRATLHLKTRMVHFKNKNHHGQREGTRSRTLIDGVQRRVDSWAQKYRDARKAKLLLSSPGPWEEVLRPLEPGDVRSYVDPEIPTRKPVNTSDPSGLDDSLMDDTMDRADRRRPTGETRRTFSWIWISIPAAIARGEEGMDDSESLFIVLL
jgi:hypothetical protein